jgi:hypothetical protein
MALRMGAIYDCIIVIVLKCVGGTIVLWISCDCHIGIIALAYEGLVTMPHKGKGLNLKVRCVLL